jgi:GH15 family glucan-1,4-alpha-glucosidase
VEPILAAWEDDAVPMETYPAGTDDASSVMVRLVGFANDFGLLSEEYDPGTGRLAGNFPQAFSSLGLIRAPDAIQECRG